MQEKSRNPPKKSLPSAVGMKTTEQTGQRQKQTVPTLLGLLSKCHSTQGNVTDSEGDSGCRQQSCLKGQFAQQGAAHV